MPSHLWATGRVKGEVSLHAHLVFGVPIKSTNKGSNIQLLPALEGGVLEFGELKSSADFTGATKQQSDSNDYQSLRADIHFYF